MLAKRLQPRSYHEFRCIGADCEDTCCTGWLVNVDHSTFEAYQQCEDADLGPRLRELVSINPASTGADNYARIGLSGTSCPFLTEGLCAIQNKLGESYLSIVCSRFPRVMNAVDDVLERSLDMACPEAARMVLLDPNPMEFDHEEGPAHDPRTGKLETLTTADTNSSKPYAHFHEIRAFVIELLQHRAYPLWKRLIILGSFCDQLEELAVKGQSVQVPDAVTWFREAIRSNSLDEAIHSRVAMPALQLELVLELIVARITSEFTSPRFFDCYRAFKDGIDWTPESSMDDIGRRYAAAYTQHFTPFLNAHGHMLEHYLVSYVHRTLFPLGAQERTRDPLETHAADTIREQCLMLLVHYAVIQTVLIGMAAFHGAEFSTVHAIQAIQSATKAFMHNLSFPARALNILAGKGVNNCTALAILLRM